MTDEELRDYKALRLLNPNTVYNANEIRELFQTVMSRQEAVALHAEYTQKYFYTNEGAINCKLTDIGKQRLERVSMLNEMQAMQFEALKRDKENADLKRLLEESTLLLNEAQKADIKPNAINRNNTLYWQIATVILSVIVLLLKFFGVKGWLE